MNEAVAPVKPRDAASVILLRQPDLVYMTARPTTLRVAAGFYVFPGGRVDAPDRTLANADPTQLHVPPLEKAHAHYVAAAVREVFEEVGLLLARDARGLPLWQEEGVAVHEAALRDARNELNSEQSDLPTVLKRYEWTVAADRLAYVSRWVTPPAARRRFDTRFFVADVSGCVAPEPHPAEVERAEWMPLTDTLRRDEAGTLPLMRPTRALLHTLANIGETATIMTHYRRHDSPRLEVVERNTPEVLEAVLASQGVSFIQVPSPTLLPANGTNVYLIAGGGEAVLVDAGDGGEAGVQLVVDAWARAGKPKVKALIVTHDHPDHAGAAADLIATFRCSLAVHEAAAPRWPKRFGLTPDIVLHGGEFIQVGRRRIEVIHSPGHASDHISLYEAETGLLFSGDNIVGHGSTWVGPPDGDMDAYLHSLAHLQTRRIHIIAPGHGPLLDGASQRIGDLIERRRAREAEIIHLLQQKPRTAAQLFDVLYKDAVPPGVAEMARRTVLGHLIKLQADGVVRARDQGAEDVRYEAVPADARP